METFKSHEIYYSKKRPYRIFSPRIWYVNPDYLRCTWGKLLGLQPRSDITRLKYGWVSSSISLELLTLSHSSFEPHWNLELSFLLYNKHQSKSAIVAARPVFCIFFNLYPQWLSHEKASQMAQSSHHDLCNNVTSLPPLLSLHLPEGFVTRT